MFPFGDTEECSRILHNYCSSHFLECFLCRLCPSSKLRWDMGVTITKHSCHLLTAYCMPGTSTWLSFTMTLEGGICN